MLLLRSVSLCARDPPVARHLRPVRASISLGVSRNPDKVNKRHGRE
jgi:hypothetical protein